MSWLPLTNTTPLVVLCLSHSPKTDAFFQDDPLLLLSTHSAMKAGIPSSQLHFGAVGLRFSEPENYWGAAKITDV